MMHTARASVGAWVRGALSALAPGVGQALAGRWVDALLFVGASAWVHLTLGGLATAPGVEDLHAALGGAFVGARTPMVVVFTVLAVVLHGLAAWDASHTR